METNTCSYWTEWHNLDTNTWKKLDIRPTLRLLASGESYVSLRYLFRPFRNSISKLIPEMLDAIYDALVEYTNIPNSGEQWKAIEREFAEKWNVPGSCEFTDGKHAVIHA